MKEHNFYKYKGPSEGDLIHDAVYDVSESPWAIILTSNTGKDFIYDGCFEDNFIKSGIQYPNWKNKNYLQIEASHDEKVNHPSHYTWLKELCGIEVIDITRHMDFDLGNAIKYILRCGHKSEQGYTDREKTIEDLRKAIFYINDKINQLEG